MGEQGSQGPSEINLAGAPDAPRVLVASTDSWPFAARLAIALAHAGAEVAAICPRVHLLRKSRAVRRIFPYSPTAALRSLVDAIRAFGPDLIVPCDERAVEHVHQLHGEARRFGKLALELEALIERSIGHPDSYGIVSARYRLLCTASEEGIPLPETKLIGSDADCDALDASPQSSWVLKADGTWGGRGVRIAESPAQAKRIFAQLNRIFGFPRALKRTIVNRDLFWSRIWPRRPRPPIIAQRYIPGIPANCAVFCWQGRVLAGIGVEVLSAEGMTKPATIVRVVDNPAMMGAAARLAKRLRLSGFFGLDFILEQGSGVPYLIEMNPRPTPLCHLRLGDRRDMIGALMEQLAGQALPAVPPVTSKDVIAYFPQALGEKSEHFESAFLDAPQNEPELTEALLRPGRGLLVRWGLRRPSPRSSACAPNAAKGAAQ